ncbi:MAG: PhnD/SsuA/transferrin family substrate-binding protein, partial [Proteobacteria bacterium]|nr:PhnD/SsuA/transferrin family substrate-binding protein [Pseudomonadota bacterium]
EHFEAFFRKTVSQRIKPIAIDSHTAMCEALLGRMPVIAWAPPMACARVVTHGGDAPLRLIRHGCNTCRAAVVHRRDRIIEGDVLNQLSAVWIGQDSTAGYLLPRAWLWSQGVPPERMLRKELFVQSYPAALQAVLTGRADITTVPAYGHRGKRTPALDDLRRSEREQLQILLTTDSAPNDGIAFSAEVSPAIQSEVVSAFLEAASSVEGRTLLREVFGAEQLEYCEDGFASMGAVLLASQGLSNSKVEHQAQIETPWSHWSEELKFATILFADIVDFTACTSTLQPDVVHELTNEIFAPLTRAVERRGGTVLKYIGDCIMAVFGVPRAHEDDPHRAAEAALEMSERLHQLDERFEKRYGSRIRLRTGLHTGLVMVGAVGGG